MKVTITVNSASKRENTGLITLLHLCYGFLQFVFEGLPLWCTIELCIYLRWLIGKTILFV